MHLITRIVEYTEGKPRDSAFLHFLIHRFHSFIFPSIRISSESLYQLLLSISYISQFICSFLSSHCSVPVYLFNLSANNIHPNKVIFSTVFLNTNSHFSSLFTITLILHYIQLCFLSCSFYGTIIISFCNWSSNYLKSLANNILCKVF